MKESKRNKFVRIARNVQRRNNIYYLYANDNTRMIHKRVVKKHRYNVTLSEHDNNIIAIQKQKEFEKDLNYNISLSRVIKEYECIMLPSKKVNTQNEYKHIINKYIADSYIYNTNIKELKSNTMLEYLNTIKNINARYKAMCILKQVFEYAQINKYIDINVMYYINKKSINAECETTRQEQIYNIHELLAYFNTNNDIDYIIIILLLCGLRIGELLALETKDINTKDRVININKSLSYIDKSFTTDTPKTKNGIRKVAYSKYLDSILHELITKAQRKNSKLLISDKQGNYIKYNSLVKALKQRTKGSKYKSLHFHLCRKIYINACLDLSIAPLEVVKRVGHKNLDTIVSNYYNY